MDAHLRHQEGRIGEPLQKRPSARFVIYEAAMIGTKPIGSVTFTKTKTVVNDDKRSLPSPSILLRKRFVEKALYFHDVMLLHEHPVYLNMG